MKRPFLVGGIAGAALTIALAQIAHPQTSSHAQPVSGQPQAGGIDWDAASSRQPANINLTRPPKPERDPNGLYQFGEKIAVVEQPRVDLAQKTVHFATIKKAPTLNIDADFEYQNFVLHYQKAGDELIVGGAAAAVPNRVFADVICKIVSVRE